MAGFAELDAHQRPPERLRSIFKKYQKLTANECGEDPGLIDFANLSEAAKASLTRRQMFEAKDLIQSFNNFARTDFATIMDRPAYEIHDLPGLYIIPDLFPPLVQFALLDKLIHRDLSNPAHSTNLHMHYDIPYEALETVVVTGNVTASSFFAADQSTPLKPKDSTIHKPISIEQMLRKKLRWITIGGQYNWTAKTYPKWPPPSFPEDIRELLGRLFPDVEAQAAIVNFYSPGDTLSVHRDVSEECDRGLISVSFGCDGIFMAGNLDGSRSAVMRLRSGDAVLMTGNSRFAWHGVPLVMASTCPGWLQSWPAESQQSGIHAGWKGWLSNKRINLNVRQMRAS